MRRTTVGALACAFLLAGAAFAQVPDTPAGRQLSALINAINSGNRATIQQFFDSSYPGQPVDSALALSKLTGGYDVRSVALSESLRIVVLAQERADPRAVVRLLVLVQAESPNRIRRFQILAERSSERPPELAYTPLTEPELVTALRAKLDQDASDDRFAGAALVARIENRTPRVVFSGAYGMADRARRVANTLDTRFRIASMNKMFTAVSILQLVQAGRIRLTDPLGKYVPDYPNRDVANKVTIHHLLTHTGGMGDYLGPDFLAHRLELRTLDDYVKRFGARDPAFEPGSRYAYSNYGMLLLGVVVERVTGRSYYDYVTDNIYKPAGMTRSGSEPEDGIVPDRAVGYTHFFGSEAWTPNTETLQYRGTPAGGGFSTVGDMVRFATALMNHQLLNAEHTTLLITGKVDAGFGRMYAYGFEDGRKDGVGAVGHSGGIVGVSADLRIYPRAGYVVVVLSNLDPPAATAVSAFVDLRIPRSR
jgi:D-alanyl-D-alanine carboxypeptidase